MSLNHANKKETAGGFEEKYGFKQVETIGLTLQTIVGGYENLDAVKFDRVIIVKKGLGFAKMQGKSFRLEENEVLEIPQGVSVDLNGQLQFYLISSKNM